MGREGVRQTETETETDRDREREPENHSRRSVYLKVLKSVNSLSKLISIIDDTTFSVAGGTLLSKAFLYKINELASLSSSHANHITTFRMKFQTHLLSLVWELESEM